MDTSSLTGDGGAVVLDFCSAVRGILNDNHGGPRNPPGIRMVDALADVHKRAIEKKHPETTENIVFLKRTGEVGLALSFAPHAGRGLKRSSTGRPATKFTFRPARGARIETLRDSVPL